MNKIMITVFALGLSSMAFAYDTYLSDHMNIGEGNDIHTTQVGTDDDRIYSPVQVGDSDQSELYGIIIDGE